MNRQWLTYLKGLFTSGGQLALAEADNMLLQLTDTGKVPGMVVSVHCNGQLLLQKGYGYSDLESRKAPDPAKTLFRIASISKPIAATALLHMVEEGLIDLDASFYEYVPYFPRKTYDFTIRQLAGHTAGVRGYQGKEYGLNEPYTIRESLEIFKDDPLLFKPGTAYSYTSFDWVLLSLAMEEVSGMPFSQYVASRVLTPLGMLATIPEIQGSKPRELASFYSPSANGFHPAIPVNNEYKLAGGGYLSTATDIARFGQAYLDGLIGTPALVSEFLETGEIGGIPSWYGLGWEVSYDAANRPFYGHTGNSVGAFSRFLVFPETRTVFVILVNCGNPGIESETEQFIDFFLREVWEKGNF